MKRERRYVYERNAKMKCVKYVSIILGLGVFLGVTGVVNAELGKVEGQVDVTLDNAETEIENIMNAQEQALVCDNVISIRGQEIYTNRDGDLYYTNGADEIIGYSSNVEPANQEKGKVAEADVLEAAEVYLKQLVNDVSYYQLDDISYDEYTYSYSIVYVHKIGGVKTTDIVYLGINNELNLNTFMIPRPYAFQKMENVEINKEAILQKALDIFGKEYGGERINAEGMSLQLGTDEEEHICYQVEVKSNIIVDGEEMEDWEIVYVPLDIEK